MSIEKPDERTRNSIESAGAWFKSKLRLREVRQAFSLMRPGRPREPIKRWCADPDAPPLLGSILRPARMKNHSFAVGMGFPVTRSTKFPTSAGTDIPGWENMPVSLLVQVTTPIGKRKTPGNPGPYGAGMPVATCTGEVCLTARPKPSCPSLSLPIPRIEPSLIRM